MAYHAGDPATHLYVVAAGKIKLIRHTLQGKDVLLDLLGQGEHFGSLSPNPQLEYEDSAQALTSACVLVIGSEAFRAILVRYPAVSLRLVDLIQERLQSSQRRIQWLSLQSVEQRIAYLLLHLAEKFGQPSPLGTLIQIPLSRDALSEMAGTTPESASRSMSRLQKQGYIESGRQWVAVRDIEKLKEQVGEAE
jgi:CRP-like cAMP-binding protein